MKQILLCLLGNRDLQFPFSSADKPVIRDFFISHNDGNNLIINKSSNAGFKFLDASRLCFEHYHSLKEEVIFPMIQGSLDYLRQTYGLIPDELVFSSSAQDPMYAQDCYYFGEFAASYYKEQGFEARNIPFPVNPNDMEKMLDYYQQLFSELDQGKHQLIISNSGGTPTMRSASHFAGLFRGYQFVHIVSSKASEMDEFESRVLSNTYQEQEMRIIQELIARNLNSYDYQGVLNLLESYFKPGQIAHMNSFFQLQQIYKKCQEALDAYSLNTDLVDQSLSYSIRGIQALELIYSNMIACYHKGAYADVIGRIFRLEEAIGQVLFYQWLKEEGVLTENDRILGFLKNGEDLSYDNLLALKREKEELITRFGASSLIEEKQIRINEQTMKKKIYNIYYFHKYRERKVKLKAVSSGKNLFFFFFTSLDIVRKEKKYQGLYSFFDKLNNGYPYPEGNPLSDLRNKSILGHGHKGIGKSDLEDITGNFEAFCREIADRAEPLIGRKLKNVFEGINKEIRELMR